MAMSDWPLQERPREKLLRMGVSSLSEAELLAIFLRTGTKGRTAVDLARELLQRYQTLHALLATPLSQVSLIKGVGKTKYVMLQAALELGRRYLEENLQHRPALTCPSDVKQYLIAKFSGYKQEIFACIFLNSKHSIIRYEELFKGTLAYAPIYPRIIAQKALEYNAGALILAHNHPSGNSKPSDSDIASTKNLITILDHLEIKIVDHLVIGANDCCSLAEQGFI